MKVVKKGIKQAILMYYDPEIEDYRRVVFGDPETLMDMLITQGQLVMDRIQDMTRAKPKNAKELKEVIKKTKPDFVLEHGADAAEDAELALSYELKKLK